LESLRHFPTADASKDASVDRCVGILHQAAAILGYLIYAIRTNSFVFARIGVFYAHAMWENPQSASMRGLKFIAPNSGVTVGLRLQNYR
jgi:hypothetical protein